MTISDKEYVSLPKRPFLYTLDQLATILVISQKSMNQRIYFSGRSTMRKIPKQMLAHNISPPTMPPDWRVSEDELTRWLKECGYRIHSTGHIY